MSAEQVLGMYIDIPGIWKVNISQGDLKLMNVELLTSEAQNRHRKV